MRLLIVLSVDPLTDSRTQHPCISLPHISGSWYCVDIGTCYILCVYVAVDLMQGRLSSLKESDSLSQTAHCPWLMEPITMSMSSSRLSEHHLDVQIVSSLQHSAHLLFHCPHLMSDSLFIFVFPCLFISPLSLICLIAFSHKPFLSFPHFSCLLHCRQSWCYHRALISYHLCSGMWTLCGEADIGHLSKVGYLLGTAVHI